MGKKGINIAIVFVVFVFTIVIGIAFVRLSALGFLESAILYLSGVVAAGLFWVGRDK